jgi:hypothetical protein
LNGEIFYGVCSRSPIGKIDIDGGIFSSLGVMG